MGHAVLQLVEALRYESEGRGFDSRWCHWNFSASNGNENQEYLLGSKGGRCLGLTTIPLSWADCLEIWKPQLPGTLRAYPGLFRDFFASTKWTWAVTRLRRLVACLSVQRPGLNPGPGQLVRDLWWTNGTKTSISPSTSGVSCKYHSIHVSYPFLYYGLYVVVN